MDNLPKDKNQQGEAPAPSGDIFSNVPEAGYEQATQLTPEGNQQEAAYQSAEVPLSAPQGYPTEYIQQETPAEGSPANGQNPPAPPPFIEDKARKFIGIGVAVLLILVIAFGLFAFFKSRSKKPEPPAKITLTYWGLWEDEIIFKQIIDDYQRLHSNITISYSKQDQKQYRERLQATIDRGEGPDLFRFHNTWLPMIIRQLAPVPKTVYTDDDFTKKFYPVVTSDLKASGNYFGIPLSIDGLLLFYNEDILKSANIAVPTTWVDVQNAVSKLTVKENERIVTSAIALGTAENVEHFSDILGLMMLQNGTQPVTSLFSCADSGTNCAVEALTFYHKFAESPNNSWDNTLENSILAFAGGKVAMIFAPSWQVFTIKQLAPNLNFKTAPVPQLPCDRQPCPSVNLASYWVEGVSVKSKNQEAAFDFLKYLSSPETLQKNYTEQSKVRAFGEAYSLVELGKLLTENPYLSAIISQAPTMKSFYGVSRTFDGETGLDTSLLTYLKDAVNSLSQGTSPESALKTADNGFKQVFTRFGLSTAQ